MKNMTTWKGLVLSACVALAAAACGDDDPSKNNSSGTNVTTNNTTNNTTINNSTSNNDLCVGVDCSTEQPAPSCDGDNLVESVSDGCNSETGMCEFTEMRTDCAATDQVCMDGACVDGTDLCLGVDCGAPAPTCDGEIVVELADGTCDPATGMCMMGDETRTDCTETDQVCVDGACVADAGPCAGVTCDQPIDGCDLQEVVVYSGAGVCDMGTGACDFTAVETRTDCTATAEICVNAACVADDDASVAAGDLVITEFMQNPAAPVDDTYGEWFEIYNATARTLDIEGLILDDGSNQLTIAGPGGTFPVPGFSYVVVGKNQIVDDQDPAYNGGVDVDIVFDNMSLANGSDAVTIFAADGITVIDTVAWDNGATFPDGNGVAAMFGGENDPLVDDNADGQFWCEAITPYGKGDLGTPGTANEPCPEPVPPMVTTIYDIQDTSAANHPAQDVPLILEDVVITAIGDGRLFVQEPGGGQYSGIYVSAFSLDLSTLTVGDVVRLEGSYDEGNGGTSGLTSFTAEAMVPANMQMTVAPEIVASSDLATDVGAEPWEGVLIQVVEAGVTNSNPDGPGNDFGEFRLDASIRVDEFLFDFDAEATGDPANCWIFESLTGPLNYSFGNFKILPRDANDFVVADATLTSQGAAANVMVGMGGLNYSPSSLCVATGATVTWDWSSGLHDVESRDAGAMTPAATKTLDSPDLMMAGDQYTFTFADAGSYHYLCSYHAASMQGQVVVVE